jgi:hypothetical protein
VTKVIQHIISGGYIPRMKLEGISREQVVSVLSAYQWSSPKALKQNANKIKESKIEYSMEILEQSKVAERKPAPKSRPTSSRPITSSRPTSARPQSAKSESKKQNAASVVRSAAVFSQSQPRTPLPIVPRKVETMDSVRMHVTVALETLISQSDFLQRYDQLCTIRDLSQFQAKGKPIHLDFNIDQIRTIYTKLEVVIDEGDGTASD